MCHYAWIIVNRILVTRAAKITNDRNVITGSQRKVGAVVEHFIHNCLIRLRLVAIHGYSLEMFRVTDRQSPNLISSTVTPNNISVLSEHQTKVAHFYGRKSL